MGNKERFCGIIPPLMVPLKEDHLHLDEDACIAMINHVIDNGCTGVFAVSSSGESMHNGRPAWERAHQIALEMGKDKFPVVSCAVSASTAQAIDNVKYLEDIGATTVALTPPFYTAGTMQSEIIRHYETVLNHTKADLCIYNLPQLLSGTNINVETAAYLADHERVVMIKESTPDWNQQQRTIIAMKDKDISVCSGGEAFTTSCILAGAQGNIGGLQVAFPKLFVKAYEAAKAGDVARVRELQAQIFKVMEIMNTPGASPFALYKYALVAVGIGTEVNSYHIEPLTADQKKVVEEMAAYVNSLEL